MLIIEKNFEKLWERNAGHDHCKLWNWGLSEMYIMLLYHYLLFSYQSQFYFLWRNRKRWRSSPFLRKISWNVLITSPAVTVWENKVPISLTLSASSFSTGPIARRELIVLNSISAWVRSSARYRIERSDKARRPRFNLVHWLWVVFALCRSYLVSRSVLSMQVIYITSNIWWWRTTGYLETGTSSRQVD